MLQLVNQRVGKRALAGLASVDSELLVNPSRSPQPFGCRRHITHV